MITIEEARQWYAGDDPVHDFDHVLRVLNIALRLAREEGADEKIVRAAALLHDSRGSAPGQQENSRDNHHLVSAHFAGSILNQKGWFPQEIEAVQHCIRAHRYRSTETPRTIEAKILFDADKLDVLGAIGIARTIAYAVLDNQPVYYKPSKQFVETGVKEPDEPHSSYHEYLFKLCKVKDGLYTQSAKGIAAQRHTVLEGFYSQLIGEITGDR